MCVLDFFNLRVSRVFVRTYRIVCVHRTQELRSVVQTSRRGVLPGVLDGDDGNIATSSEYQITFGLVLYVGMGRGGNVAVYFSESTLLCYREKRVEVKAG